MTKFLKIILTFIQVLLIGITGFSAFTHYNEAGFQFGWFLKYLSLELIYVAFVLILNFEYVPVIKKILSNKKSAYMLSAVMVGLSLTAFVFKDS